MSTRDRVSHSSFSTGLPDEANHVLQQVWGGSAGRSSGDRTGFRFSLEDRSHADLGVSRVVYSRRWRSTYEAEGDFAACSVVQGRLTHQRGDQQVTAGPGDVLLLQRGREVECRLDDVRGHPLRMPMSEVARVAAERTGSRPEQFAFLGMGARSSALAASWVSATHLVARELTPGSALEGSPLVRAALVEYLAATALSVFPNTTLRDDPAAPGQVGPESVRRAMEYMEANAGRPLTLSQVAGAAGIGSRALQEGFRRHHDTTPLAYLRRFRLLRAREQLLAGDEGQLTVAQVAQRWGFARADRFAQAYRGEFQESPAATLRRTTG